MKKRGVSYIEILVAVAIFSVGIVPLMLSLGHSFEASVYNRDYTRAMEYNLQLMEELGTILPTKLGLSKYSGIQGTGSLEEDVTSLVEARSEDVPSQRGIYKVVDWKDGSFDFTNGDIEGHNMYRKIIVREGIGNDETGMVVMPVDIEVRYVNTDEIIVESSMLINLGIFVDEVIGEGVLDDGRIQVKKGNEERAPENGYMDTNHTELAQHIKVFIIGVGQGANDYKVEEADVGVFRNGYETIYNMPKEEPDIFSRNIDIEVGDKLAFYMRTVGGTANVDQIRYQLYRNKK